MVLDIVVVAHGPVVAATDTPGSVRFRAGGSAATTARAVAWLGGSATFVGAVGDDAVGRLLNAELRRAGVTARTVVHPAPTARLVVQLSGGGERSFITQRGAADLLVPGDLDPVWFRGVRVLHLPLYSLINEPLGSAARRAVALVRSGAGLVSVDLASVGPLEAFGLRATERLLRAVAPDILFANTAEAALFGARTWPARLLELAPVVVVKQGASGCEVIMEGGRRFRVATKPLTVSDTTGAGDAFDAGFLLRLLESDVPGAPLTAARLRSAVVAGNRAAGKLLSSPRADLGW